MLPLIALKDHNTLLLFQLSFEVFVIFKEPAINKTASLKNFRGQISTIFKFRLDKTGTAEITVFKVTVLKFYTRYRAV